MLIEIHMIQNHAPANLNRDDLGAPKTCMFGGVERLRISSQALKRRIRRSEAFQAALERERGVRTRKLVTELAERVAGTKPTEEMLSFIVDVLEKGGAKYDDKKEVTKVLLFLPESAIDQMAEALRNEKDRGDAAKERVTQKFAEILAS
ncbi:MAG TPA: type I-E CRISPR-associated protein Cas7/Cse4/CasC, partial [Candidatus Brocadiia bacterium]|nr:type I-E CRISPR-associated protein Cas7/Cse4/CasC [Candidatus Brocadiia bacterium]